MNVGCKCILSDEAMAAFKDKVGRPTRLNFKVWALQTLSDALGAEITTNYSASQKKAMKKMKPLKEDRTTVRDQLDGLNRDPEKKPKTVPTILQRPKDEPRKKKFMLRKK